MSDAGATGQNQGLAVLDMVGNTPEAQLMIRNGRLNLDIASKIVSGGPYVDETHDLADENLFVGAAGFGDLLARWTGDNTAHTLRLRVWATEACMLSGASPIIDRTVDSWGDNTLGEFNAMNAVFTPTGAVKYAHVADWETMAVAVAANPFAVTG